MRFLVALTLVLVSLAGCAGGDDAPPAPPAIADWPFVPDCTDADSSTTDGNVCRKTLLGGDQTNWEPHLAVDPADADRILVSWTHYDTADLTAQMQVQIVAALSEDGGASWTTVVLDDAGPLAPVPDTPATFHFSFDSISAFGPDGTAYVLFGGEETSTVAGLGPVVHWQMTLASSTDGGATWTYGPMNENLLGLENDDYMDMDASPDSGHVYVVTDAYGNPVTGTVTGGPVNALEFYRTMDDGATWESTLLDEGADTNQFPRIAAGRGGLVVVTAQRDGGSFYSGLTAWVSNDHGATFDGPVAITSLGNDFYDSQHPAILGDRIDVVQSTADHEVYVVRSLDAGATWRDPVRVSGPYDDKDVTVWEVAIDNATGDLFFLEKRTPQQMDGFDLDLVRVGVFGGVDRMPLVRSSLGSNVFTGGHYAGIDVSPDGSVWTTWGDPRDTPQSIAVARLLPP